MIAVTAGGLSKSFGDAEAPVKAVNEVNFEVEAGSIFGIIGPDGAGKTTLFRLLTTLLLPDSGSATVDGLDIIRDYRQIRSRVGYMPGRFSLYPDLTVAENLEFFATTFNTSIQENYSLIKDIYQQIEPFKNRRAGKLSGGMKQKLALSCALIHRPTVLFLDEPTTGVDAVSRREFWEMLQRLKQDGITILVSTPYMDEANQCDRIALIQNGRILSINTPRAIIQEFTKPLFAMRSSNMLSLLRELNGKREVADAYPFGEFHHVVFKDRGAAETIVGDLGSQDVEIAEVEPTIEDCFIDLMKSHG